MYTDTQSVLSNAPAIRAMLNFNERISLNFADTDIATTVGIMRCLIERGVNTFPAIYDFLSERESRFDRKMIGFLLKHFEGHDVRHHLWTAGEADGYVALTRQGPALWTSTDGYDLD